MFKVYIIILSLAQGIRFNMIAPDEIISYAILA